MDLRIDAKKDCAVTLTKKNSNQVMGYRTPSTSIRSNPRAPHTTPSVTITRRYRPLLEKVHSAATASVSAGASSAPARRYTNISPLALAMFRRKAQIPPRSDTKPSTMILRKLQQLKRASDVGTKESPPRQPLVYRTMVNFSKIDENAFIRIDEQGFHEKKRLRIQTEDDLLKDENILKKFKPNDYQSLSKRLKSSKDIDLMALLLQSTLSNPNFLPRNESLAWLGYIACMQRSRESDLRDCPKINQIKKRFRGTLKKVRKLEVKLLSFKKKGAIVTRKKKTDNPTPEEPENAENPKLPEVQIFKISQESNNQVPEPQEQNGLALKNVAPAKPQPVALGSPAPNNQDPVPNQDNLALKHIAPAKPQPAALGSPAPNNQVSVLKQEILALKYIAPAKPQPVALGSPAPNNQDPVLKQEILALKYIAPAKPQPAVLGSSATNNQVSLLKQENLALKYIAPAKPQPAALGSPAPNNQDPVPNQENLALKYFAPAKPQPVAVGSPAPNNQVSLLKQEILALKYIAPAKQPAVLGSPATNNQAPLPNQEKHAWKDFVPAKSQSLAFGSLAPNNQIHVLKENHAWKDFVPAKPQPVTLGSPALQKGLKNPLDSKQLQGVNQIGREVAIKYPYPCKHNPDLYVIGPNGSTIAKTSWENINWDQTPAAITRKILMCLFDKYTLATHSLSGRPSPAFKGIYKAEKKPLHAGKVADTVSIVTSHVNVTAKEVRMAITTKCADECKMLRIRQEKKSKINKEFLEKMGAQQV